MIQYAVHSGGELILRTLSNSAAEAVDKFVGNFARRGGETNEEVFQKYYGATIHEVEVYITDHGPVKE